MVIYYDAKRCASYMDQSRRYPVVVLIRITLGWFKCLTKFATQQLLARPLPSIHWIEYHENIITLQWPPYEFTNYYIIVRRNFSNTAQCCAGGIQLDFTIMKCVCLRLMFFLLLCFGSYNIILCSQLSKRQHELSNVNLFIKHKNFKSTV